MAKSKLDSTKYFVEIADIRDTLLMLDDGTLRSVIEVQSINFDLKSQDEQMGVIRGFQDFLNSVDFNVQIVVHSRRLDIGPYIKRLDETFSTLTNELLQIQAKEYIRFIKGISELAHIMSKRFFISVPYYPIEAANASVSGIKSLFKGVAGKMIQHKAISDEDLEKNEELMNQRLSLIIAGLTALGLSVKVLGSRELLDLCSEYYRPPQTVEIQK